MKFTQQATKTWVHTRNPSNGRAIQFTLLNWRYFRTAKCILFCSGAVIRSNTDL